MLDLRVDVAQLKQLHDEKGKLDEVPLPYQHGTRNHPPPTPRYPKPRLVLVSALEVTSLLN